MNKRQRKKRYKQAIVGYHAMLRNSTIMLYTVGETSASPDPSIYDMATEDRAVPVPVTFVSPPPGATQQCARITAVLPQRPQQQILRVYVDGVEVDAIDNEDGTVTLPFAPTAGLHNFSFPYDVAEQREQSVDPLDAICTACGTPDLEVWYTGQRWGETLCEACYEERVAKEELRQTLDKNVTCRR